MSMEDLLGEMFKFTKGGMGKDVNTMLGTLVRNVQINTLKMLRQQIDNNIKKLTSETPSGYDPNLDPYKILGIEPSATREDIDKAYRKKAREAHPDRGGSDRDMIMVNAAYEAIRQFRGWK